MKFEETSPGSLIASGIGLQYKYTRYNNALQIFPREKREAITEFYFDRSLSEDPYSYINALEKKTQIKALMYSGNRTIDLTETIDHTKISTILKGNAAICRHAYDLEKLNLERFCKLFAQEFNLKTVKIKHFTSSDQSNAFFIARIHTQHDNAISVRACSMVGITAALSEKTLRDLILMEYGHKFGGSAQNLLQVSQRFSTISHILDENFIPARRLKAKESSENSIPNIY